MDVEGYLLSPREGDTVGSTILIQGKAAMVPPGYDLWIVNARSAGTLIWPKEPRITLNESGDFSFNIYEAGSPGRIIISLLLVSKETSKHFEEWLRNGLITGDYPGIVIPNDATELSRVSVTYNPDIKPLTVFLCHSSKDKEVIRRLYRRLVEDKIDVWLDEERLLPGQDWQFEIRKALKQSDAVIVGLSNSSISRSGFIQKEIRYALDIADEQPEGTIFLIPVRLDECEVPERLRIWQWVDLFEDGGYERLLNSLRLRAKIIRHEIR